MIRRAILTLIVLTAALAAAVFLLALILGFPPAPVEVQRNTVLDADAARAARTVPGAIHIHTNRSDGTGTPDSIAAAAARAGLKFVVFNDHGDGTREPDPPQYRSGVLCLDGVEISTKGGHCLAIGMAASPYPLGGEGRDVVEDVQRLGGLAIAAHPASPKPELRWSDWDAPIDGLEWINTDSEWRDESRKAIARAAAGYFFRGPQALATLLDQPREVLARWDALTGRRPVIAIAGADAHARIINTSRTDPYEGVVSLPIPSYETSFKVFSNRVVLERAFTGQAQADAATLLRSLRAGHVYTTIDALAKPGLLRVSAGSGTSGGELGDAVPLQDSATLEAHVQAPAGARLILLRRGEPVAESTGNALTYTAPGEPAAYRIEVRIPGAPGTPPVPWLLANPVYLRFDAAPLSKPELGPPAETRLLPQPREWRAEHAPGSSITLRPGPDGALIDYTLAPGERQSQYVAAVVPVGREFTEYRRLAFTASAEGPSRISVQVRKPHVGERWQRSIYLDSTPRVVTIPLDELRRVTSTSSLQPDLGAIDSLLFVVDTTNTRPGKAGWVMVGGVRLER